MKAGTRAVGLALLGWLAIHTAPTASAAAWPYLTPPYLQNVKPDGITIMWEWAGVRTARVEYGLDMGYGQSQPVTIESSGFGSFIYKCVLTELVPGARYHYRVVLDGRPGIDRTFVTAPDGPVDFTFAVWGDSQGNNHGAYLPDPDEPTKAMMRHMATNGVAFAVAVGDMAEDGNSYSDTRRYYLDRVARLLGPRVPWFVAWGNHDGGRDAVIRKFADHPSKENPRWTPGYGSFSFDYGGCHFICIDYAVMEASILGWLRRDLEQAAARQPRFIFLFVHVPPYCELWIDGSSFNRRELVPLLEQYHVNVCFSGHTHEYSRGYQNGVYYCITGGGSWLDIPESLVKDWPHMTVGGYHLIPGVPDRGPGHGGGLINEYVRVEVRGDTFTASMIAFRPDGTEVGVLDTFSQKHQAPDNQPPAQPVLSGPATVDFFHDTELTLTSSPFSDPDPGDTHARSDWRIYLHDPRFDASLLVLERITEGATDTLTLSPRELAPGRTFYATVRHFTAEGAASSESEPLAIQVRPEPVYFEDFENTPEFQLPLGWVAEHRTSVDHDTNDPDDPQSNVYLTWTVVAEDRLGRLGGNRLSVPAVVAGQSLYAESDHRGGVQRQFLTTPDFDLSGLKEATLTFLSNYMQNQDSLGALEYSVDGGATWQPVVYLLDEPDVIRRADGQTVDGQATFSRVDNSGVPPADGWNSSGGTYGEHVLSRPWLALGEFVSARVNDDPTESKRLERFRLPAADGQSRVRFRFTYVGTASWYWGVDDFALFGVPDEAPPPRFTEIRLVDGQLHLAWEAASGSVRLEYRDDLTDGTWRDVAVELAPGQTAVTLPLAGHPRFFRLRAEP